MGASRTKGRAVPVGPDGREKVFFWLLPLLLFLSITALSGPIVVVLVVAALAFGLGKSPAALLSQRLSLLTAGVGIYCAVSLCSGLWSHFGSYAGRESIKTLVALAMFLLVLVRVQKSGLRALLWALSGCLAVVGLLCVDGSSWGVLTRGFAALMGLLGVPYNTATMGYEVGVRITGIYSNANVSAGILAFGLIISLYLFQTEEKEKHRLMAALLLGVQALAFFLSFSMGAMGAFALTCVVYLICAGKENRLRLFLLMVECVVVTLVCAFGSYPMLGSSGAKALVPLVLALVCGPVIFVLDRFVGRPLSTALAGKGKAVTIAIAALFVLLVGYAVVAMNVTGGTTLKAGATLSRAVALEAGDYQVQEMTWETQVQVEIYSQNEQELMMHTRTVLYQGDLSQASFTVPQESRVVWFVMSGQGDLDQVILSDGTKVPLGYPLLPGFAANRLQALWANQNFIQRLVFFRDGLKLWSQSPIYGWGLGGVEGQLTAVQSFYYETKYIHNQFIQIMDEAGIIGLAAFLFLLGGAIFLLVKNRKEQRDPLMPMLAACLTMMIAHSLTEVVWSTQMYQTVVFVLFAVLIIHLSQPQQSAARGKTRAAAVGLWGVTVVFALLQAGSLIAAWQFAALPNQDLSQEQVVSKLGLMDTLDVYGDSTYKVNRMANALQTGQTGIATRCAQDLMARKEFDGCYYAAAYYYLPMRSMDGYFNAANVALTQEASNAEAWNSIFNLHRQAFHQLSGDEMDAFVSGVCAMGDRLEQFNQGRMEQITLSEENQALLDAALQAQELGLSGESAYAALALLLS